MKPIVIVLAALLSLLACDREKSGNNARQSTGISLHTELGGAAPGFKRACSSREFNFPQDHAAHKSFRNEWWYITGNLKDTSGRRFGFHITFFRIANEPPGLQPSSDKNKSNWRSDQFYMAHFAVTAEDGEIKTYERFSRAAAGLAGAESDGNNVVKVWLDDWQLFAQQNHGELLWHLNLKTEDVELKLQLTAIKPLVLQGDAGYSRKSADPCNASFYYSYTRLKASGSLALKSSEETVTHVVEGSSWLDREWSSSALGDNQNGWDWFALQLNDGRDIMLYQLRNNDGSRDSYSHAVEIDRYGNTAEIPIENIDLEITRWWTSDTGTSYPVEGVIYRRDTNETILFEPLVDNQLLDLTVRYWEGAIYLTDTNKSAIGRGYMELTGY